MEVKFFMRQGGIIQIIKSWGRLCSFHIIPSLKGKIGELCSLDLYKNLGPVPQGVLHLGENRLG